MDGMGWDGMEWEEIQNSLMEQVFTRDEYWVGFTFPLAPTKLGSHHKPIN